MQGKPQDYMSVGMIQFMAFPATAKDESLIPESIQTFCDDDYFEVIEVTAMRDDAIRKDAVSRARKAGKKVAFGAQPVLLAGKLDLNSLDPRQRQKAVDAIRAVIPQAIEWDACGLAVLSGKDPGEKDRAQAKAMLCASLKELCEFSRRAGGPPILLEVFDRVPYGKNCLIGPAQEAAEIADRVHPFCFNFGLMMDLSHLPLLGESPDHALKAATQDLKHVHIGNCVMRDKNHPAYGDNHPMFGIPEGENGAAELKAFLKTLLDVGYIGKGKKKNIVSFEIKPFGDQTPQQVIKNAKETLDAAWKAL